MIGIFGLFQKGKNVEYINIEHTIKKLYDNNWVENKIEVSGSVHFRGGYVCRKEIQSLSGINRILETDQNIFLLDGYLADYSIDDKGFQKILINSLINKGSKLENIEGEYNIVVYSKAVKKLWVVNDRVASRPLYFINNERGLFFGSERKMIFSLLNTKGQISNQGLMEFFLFSHALGRNDIYENISPLTPATVLCLDSSSNMDFHKYWEPEIKGNFSQKKIAKELCQSVKNYSYKSLSQFEEIGMGLSGGLDSRVIAGSIPQGQNVFARTFGSKDTLEVKSAIEVAKKSGFEHVISEPLNVKFSDFIYQSVWRSEGSIPFMGLKSIVSHNYLKDKMLVNVGGQFGDILTGKTMRPWVYNPFLTRENFIDKFIDNYIILSIKRNDPFKYIFNNDFFDEHYRKAVSHFKQTLYEINADNNSNLAVLWDIKNRQPRFTFNSSSVDNYLFLKIRPFVSYQFIDLALEISPWNRFGQFLYKKSMNINFKHFKNILNANTGKTIKSSNILNAYDLLLYYINIKYRGFKEHKGYNKGEMIRNDFKLKNLLLEFINRPSFPSHIFDKDGLEKLVKLHYNNQQDFSNAIGLFATFMAASDLFVENNHSEIPEIARSF